MTDQPANSPDAPKPDTEKPEAQAAGETVPKGKPDGAAGSLNPREKAPFYEAVIKKMGKGKRR